MEGSISPDFQKALGELRTGQESAKMLEAMLIDPPARELIREVLNSISAAMVALEFVEPGHVCEGGLLIDSTRIESPSKKRKAQLVGGGGRGGYRRRMGSQSSKKVTSKTVDDGFSWRKYGQKEIFGSRFPRSYFRCTHKHGRGCQATRQVQQSEKNPSEFVITYLGDHTCRKPILGSVLSDHTSCLMSFESMDTVERLNSASSSPRSIKQEEMTSSSSDLLTSSELGQSEGLATPPPAASLGGPVSDYGDETSGFTSCVNGMDLGSMSPSFDDLGGGFGFDQDQFDDTFGFDYLDFLSC